MAPGRSIFAASVVSAVLLCAVEGSQPFPENNPDLGVYQNEENCFPLEDTWFIMYRNFKEDPYYGGDAKCIVVTQNGGYDGTSATLEVKYGGNNTGVVKATTTSSPGYNVKNVVHVESVDVPEISFNLTSVYTDCSSCTVLRHSYIDNGSGCSLWQKKKSLDQDVSCCKFVYDLLCGTSPKYQVYDDC